MLERTSFLLRQRRVKRVDGEGPRYRQTSNAYRALLPAGVRAYLSRWMRPAPLPDDRVQHDVDRAEEQAAMLAGLSCREFAIVSLRWVLGCALARLGAAIDDQDAVAVCESQNNPQPLMDLL